MSVSDPGASNGAAASGDQSGARSERKDSALYQNGRPVAEVLDPRIDADAREIRFGEVYQSDALLIPEDCEFQNYRILIQKVEFASRQQTGAAHKGRVLKNVTAEILGYRQH